MPLYDYVCDNGHITEVKRSVAERDSPMLCPECNRPVRRILSAGMATLWAGKFQGRALKKQNTDGLGSEW